jgi:hypothetical protein
MLRKFAAPAVALIILLVRLAGAQASGDSVGLGVALGVAFPSGSTARITTASGEASLDWGFYVNIPLILLFNFR